LYRFISIHQEKPNPENLTNFERFLEVAAISEILVKYFKFLE
jgi:hypothetical protein